MSLTRSQELLAELVRIASISGDEDAIATFVTDLIVDAGLDCERIGNTVLARYGKSGGPRLLLNTHLDTVPVGEGWTCDPFAAQWTDGQLFGRGSNDAKASVAAMLTSLFELAAAGSKLPGEVWLALNEREETDNFGMGRTLERLGTPDLAITGEPTGLEVVRAQSGLAVLIAEWKGRSCHAAHVAHVEHTNALLVAAQEMQQTGPYGVLDGTHPLIGDSTIAPTVLHAGERHNVVPDHAEATFDARLAPPFAGADAMKWLRERMPSAELRLRSDRLRAVETPADHPLVQAALTCASKPEAIGSRTLSDMALLPGVPAIKCGPGATERSHTPDEFVLASEVEEGTQFYSAIIPAALEAVCSAGTTA